MLSANTRMTSFAYLIKTIYNGHSFSYHIKYQALWKYQVWKYQALINLIVI